MRDVHRIVGQLEVAVTGGAEPGVDGNAGGVMLAVATQAIIGLDGLDRLDEPGLAEAIDRVAFVRALVTLQALRAGHRGAAKIGSLGAQAQRVVQLGLDLLARGAGAGLVTVTTGDIGMALLDRAVGKPMVRRPRPKPDRAKQHHRNGNRHRRTTQVHHLYPSGLETKS